MKNTNSSEQTNLHEYVYGELFQQRAATIRLSTQMNGVCLFCDCCWWCWQCRIAMVLIICAAGNILVSVSIIVSISHLLDPFVSSLATPCIYFEIGESNRW